MTVSLKINHGRIYGGKINLISAGILFDNNISNRNNFLLSLI
jgi:hypothetical protein